jgi:hypothetical protein
MSFTVVVPEISFCLLLLLCKESVCHAHNVIAIFIYKAGLIISSLFAWSCHLICTYSFCVLNHE